METAVTGSGLFLDAAIEVINDWSYGRFDEPLIEDEADGAFVIATHLFDSLKSAA